MLFYKWTSSRFDTVLAIGFIFVMAIAMPSYADEVTLRSGDIIHGKVLEQDDNDNFVERASTPHEFQLAYLDDAAGQYKTVSDLHDHVRSDVVMVSTMQKQTLRT